jgi:hypothetical protein
LYISALEFQPKRFIAETTEEREEALIASAYARKIVIGIDEMESTVASCSIGSGVELFDLAENIRSAHDKVRLSITLIAVLTSCSKDSV